jgi:UDP-N-acetyl-D-glucosamine dehydrogenase
VPELPAHGLSSADLDGSVERADCVVIVTAHSAIDYARVAERAQLVVDLRNATGADGSANGRVWKL